jgi:orotidine-5'-phosphate decarboxylase
MTMGNAGAPAPKIMLALDFPNSADARRMVTMLGGLPLIYKIGLELIYTGGLDLARALIAEGKSVFLDAKLLDIPNTVERAADSAAALGVSFVTVHGADRKTLDAAMRGRGASLMKLLAVTVLTSLDAADLKEQGVTEASLDDMVLRRAERAAEAGFDGVIASPKEVRAIRERLGDRLLIVTPGIRPAGTVAGDQARIATPAQAIAAGANHIVVGRAITRAGDPRAAALAILAEIDAAAA